MYFVYLAYKLTFQQDFHLKNRECQVGNKG